MLTLAIANGEDGVLGGDLVYVGSGRRRRIAGSDQARHYGYGPCQHA